jgi:hypothetical protein
MTYAPLRYFDCADALFISPYFQLRRLDWPGWTARQRRTHGDPIGTGRPIETAQRVEGDPVNDRATVAGIAVANRYPVTPRGSRANNGRLFIFGMAPAIYHHANF